MIAGRTRVEARCVGLGSRLGRVVAIVAAAIAGLWAIPVPARAVAISPVPSIRWGQLRNPILTAPDLALKDPAIVWANGRWWALTSSVTATGRWRVGIASSVDLRHWSPIGSLPHNPAVEGEASPDVAPAPDGTFVVTYQSFVHDVGAAEPKLYYRITRDFVTFSPAHPLGLELHPSAADRMIDPAVEWTPAGLLLGYKVGSADGVQAFEIARSASGTLDGPWILVGRPDIRVYGDTIENYQFLRLAGRWQLLATSNRLDQPFLFELTGDPSDPNGWLRWSAGRQLIIPREPWNRGRGTTGLTYEHANGAFAVNRGLIDGYYYVVYSDSPEVRSFDGAGHAQLGLARSTDLVHWRVPPR